jgi:hypothetical protein
MEWGTAEAFMILWYPEGDLNPHDRLRSADFKSAVSADILFLYKNDYV